MSAKVPDSRGWLVREDLAPRAREEVPVDPWRVVWVTVLVPVRSLMAGWGLAPCVDPWEPWLVPVAHRIPVLARCVAVPKVEMVSAALVPKVVLVPVAHRTQVGKAEARQVALVSVVLVPKVGVVPVESALAPRVALALVVHPTLVPSVAVPKVVVAIAVLAPKVVALGEVLVR